MLGKFIASSFPTWETPALSGVEAKCRARKRFHVRDEVLGDTSTTEEDSGILPRLR
jgi:hypothetical protein